MSGGRSLICEIVIESQRGVTGTKVISSSIHPLSIPYICQGCWEAGANPS